MASEPVRGPKAPLSLYVAGGVVGLVVAVMIVRWLIGLVTSVLMLAVIVAVALWILNAMARRGTPRRSR